MSENLLYAISELFAWNVFIAALMQLAQMPQASHSTGHAMTSGTDVLMKNPVWIVASRWNRHTLIPVLITVNNVHWQDSSQAVRIHKPQYNSNHVINVLESTLCIFSVPWQACCSSGTVHVPRATVSVCISLRCPRPCVPVFPLSSMNDTAGAPSPCNCIVWNSRFCACIFWEWYGIYAVPVETHLLTSLHMNGFYKRLKIYSQRATVMST